MTSPFDRNYNCIAFAAGDSQSWWWPSDDDYWPDGIPRVATIEAFVQAYGVLGYERCDDGAVEQSFEKVALFGKLGSDGTLIPTHAARQLPDGRWASKLGQFEDVEHATVEAVNCDTYGSVVCYLRRPRPPAS